jgi:hypothetical protein
MAMVHIIGMASLKFDLVGSEFLVHSYYLFVF